MILLIKSLFYSSIEKVLNDSTPFRYCYRLQIRVQHWGDDQHILVTFLILGEDDFKISFFDDLLFLLARLFFHHFLLKFNYWGDGGQILGGCIPPIPPGFAAQFKLIEMRAELANLNHCAVLFLSRAAINLSWYNSSDTWLSCIALSSMRCLKLKQCNVSD